MGKQTRAKFLVSLGALSLAALSGCAGGAPPDSVFVGTYSSTYTLPGIGENGTFSFTVEQKGRMVGSFTDASSNLVYAFDGTVENTGKFTGTMKNGATTSPLTGLLVVKGGGASGAGSTGSGGDFSVTRSGTEQRGYFTIGGTLTTVNSDFMGIYSGVYGADTSLLVDGKTLNGLASYSVDSKGNIIGSLTRGAETGLLTGTVGNTGAFQASVRFATVTLPLAGTLIKTSDGSAQGNFTFTSGSKLYPAQFSKSTSVVAGGDSPYKGSYRGTYGNPQDGENGTISYTIDPSGSIIGFFNQALNKPVGTFVGSVENDGGFSGSITYNATEVAALPAAERALYTTRNIQGKLGARVGGSGVSGDYTMIINGNTVPGNFEASIGGSEVNSSYRAAYTWNSALAPGFNANLVPGGKFTTTNNPEIAIDKQGSILGSLGSHRFDGRVTNDGRAVGQLLGNDNAWYPIRGILSKVIWKLPNASGGTDDVPGLAGNLYVTIASVEYPIAIKLVGGDGKN
ncbi:hypothetical protein [Armatimonas rosea]|uniref:Transferrin-binding protein B C-lobe/N-lobe beta barrel domain-containing protein n=1 Tax=Armatimonas rosea TaxID=685828 RepID=A0A7W9SRL7_ARMRO|nr:hypothetical protein [Armatimonas rosea]MBB6051566.1 hypothetical protein [Armatimonas rosea]